MGEVEKIDNPKAENSNLELPVLPLKDVVIFPNIVISLFVGRKSSINAVMKSLGDDKKIFLVTQKNSKDNDINLKKIYKIGVVAKILQMMRMPDGSVKVLAEGQHRAKITQFLKNENEDDFSRVLIKPLKDLKSTTLVEKATHKIILNTFGKLVKLSEKIPNEMQKILKDLPTLLLPI